MKIPIERSRNDMPCLWESGGKYPVAAKVRIIAAPDGSRKKAIFVRKRGDLACQNHALIPIAVGDITVSMFRANIDVSGEVSYVRSIDFQDFATTQIAYMFTGTLIDDKLEGTWYPDLPPFLQPAVEAAFNKLQDYHCREVYYAIKPVYANDPQGA